MDKNYITITQLSKYLKYIRKQPPTKQIVIKKSRERRMKG